MAKEGVEIGLDNDEIMGGEKLTPILPQEPKPKKAASRKQVETTGEPICCLRNERVIVRFVPRQSGIITNPKHILYGGMAEGAIRKFTVPKLSSGMFVVANDSGKSANFFVLVRVLANRKSRTVLANSPPLQNPSALQGLR